MMVWGLIEPSNFGDFFPDSDLEKDYGKWHDRLAEQFNQMPSELKAKFHNRPTSYISYVASKFTQEIGAKVGEKPPIEPLESHEKPEEFMASKTYASLGSVIKLSSRLLAVDKPLKEIIERFEPGVHDFWPMMITMPKGKVYPMQFYGMVIGQFLDSFVPELCADGILKKEDNYESYVVRMETKQNLAGVALSRSTFGTTHLWRERRLRRPNIFFSDALQTEIAKADLRMPKHYRMNEVA